MTSRTHTPKDVQKIMEPWRDSASDYERGFIDGMQKQMQSSVDKAVNRMAQPTQEFVECLNCGSHNVGIPATYDSLVDSVKAQPAQEPVGEIRASSYGHYPVVAWVNGYVAKIGDKFYTAPPQRKPLTDEAKAVVDAARTAMDDSVEAHDSEGSIKISSDLAASLSLCLDEYDRAIEAKLKEKNNG